jgi:hypothetical protein
MCPIASIICRRGKASGVDPIDHAAQSVGYLKIPRPRAVLVITRERGAPSGCAGYGGMRRSGPVEGVLGVGDRDRGDGLVRRGITAAPGDRADVAEVASLVGSQGVSPRAEGLTCQPSAKASRALLTSRRS